MGSSHPKIYPRRIQCMLAVVRIKLWKEVTLLAWIQLKRDTLEEGKSELLITKKKLDGTQLSSLADPKR